MPPLLATKLHFPPARRNLVPRPRLTARLSEGLTRPLTLISAPAGFGKTTLIADFGLRVADSDAGRSAIPHPQFCWLSLDADDNDSTRFLTYLVAALETLAPEPCASLLEILQSPQPPPTQLVLTALINDLHGTLAAPCALVLDDYHVITEQSVHEAVAFLLDHLPPQMHLAILTRADPPLPLSRLRGRGQLTEIRAADLRLTPEEAAAFLNQVMGLDLTAEQVAALEERTEGWIAGLQLAALSMQGRDDFGSFVSAFGGSHHYIVDYLTDEVLNAQSDAMRRFLLLTSILDRLTAPLCNVVTDRTDSQAQLEKLEHANLFLIPLDDERRWYRYHHLFADVLRNRLAQTYPESIPDLHRRAAEWCEQDGAVSEALGHALAAGNGEYAAHLVEKNALPMMLRGELTALLGWIAKAAAQTGGRPWLSIYQAWALVQTGRQEAAAAVLDRLEHQASPAVAPAELSEMRGHIAAIRAHVAAHCWDARSMIAFGQQALELLPEANLPIRSFVALVLGSAHLLSGDLEAARQGLAEARLLGEKARNLHVAVLSTFMLANLLADQGKLHQAVETYHQALQMATTPTGNVLPVAARALSGLSRIHYEWNDLEAVDHLAQQCVGLAERWGNINALVSAHVAQARVRQARGDLAGAQACMVDAERLALDYSLAPGGVGMVEVFRVRLWLATGDLNAAARWVQRCGFKIDDVVPPLREAEYRTFARVLLAQDKADAAQVLVKRLLLAAESAGKMGAVIELLILQALILQARNDTPQALRALERALALAQPENYMRAFLDEGAPMIGLLRQATAQRICPTYVRKLLSAAIPADMAHLLTQALVEPLSERELEVLRLMADGRSNQEIADRLILAVGTVKKHLNNIFGKLGVESRTQCVARARELNLLQ